LKILIPLLEVKELVLNPKNPHITNFHLQIRYCLILILTVLLFVSPEDGFAQRRRKKSPKRARLEAQKRENLQKIKELNQILDKTAEKKDASVGRLNALTERINKQGRQIDLITENQQLLDNEVQELSKVTGELSGNLEKLKAEYGKMLFESSKSGNKLNQLSFLFSASNFNQLARRYQYLQQYSEARKKQAQLIEKVRSELLEEQVRVLEKKKEQAQVLTEKISETQNLEGLKSKQGEVVSKLNQQERELKNQLEENKNAVSRLENMIASIVEREIRRSQERERVARAARLKSSPRERENGKTEREITTIEESTTSIAMNAEESKLATSFGALRGRMPWPVGSGFISDRFGVHQHPVLKGIDVLNNGVDIQTNAGNDVKVVYDGVIQSVMSVPGIGMIIAIQHGDYFTIYSKLSNVSVSSGQKVKSGQRIGVVATDNDGTSEINFQVWKNASKQNPEIWLRRK
jgi:murein hydrolase activator